MARGRYIAYFLLGFAPLVLLDGLSAPEDVPGGSGPALLLLALLGCLFGFLFHLLAPVVERFLLPESIRGTKQAAFACGLTWSLTPQIGPVLESVTHVDFTFGFRNAVLVFLLFWPLVFGILGRLLKSVPLPARAFTIAMAVFLVGAAVFEWRDRKTAGDRAFVGLQPASSLQKPPRSPNVILIVLDTLRWEALDRIWDDQTPMPWLADFMQRGRIYPRGYSASNFTPPGHAALFTGLYPAECGTLNRGEVVLESEQITLAEFLRNFGYRTLGVTSNFRVGANLGFGQGFEAFDDSLVADKHPVQVAVRRFTSISLFRCISGNLIRAYAKTTLKDIFVPSQSLLRAVETSAQVKKVLDAAELQDDQPLYLFVNYIDPHLPFATEEALAEKMGPNLHHPELEKMRMKGLGFHLILNRITKQIQGGDNSEDLQAALQWLDEAYWEQCLQLDAGMQTLFEDLEERGRLQDSVILITSDHGEHLGEHALFLHGNSLYEELVRVPFFLAGEGIEPGVDNVPVSTVDFFPTVCHALGVEPPDYLAGLALQNDVPADRPIRFESGTLRGYLRGSRKWLAKDHGDALEWTHAFDLSVDPRENRNLLGEDLDWVEEGVANPPMQPSSDAVVLRQVSNPELFNQLGYADETGDEDTE